MSNVIASSLTAGAVSLFAGVDALPNVSLAVLAESLRAVMSCLHADQERVLVNGREASCGHNGTRGDEYISSRERLPS